MGEFDALAAGAKTSEQPSFLEIPALEWLQGLRGSGASGEGAWRARKVPAATQRRSSVGMGALPKNPRNLPRCGQNSGFGIDYSSTLEALERRIGLRRNEALAIAWLKAASKKAVGEQVGVELG
jgi:hypothetical protein